MIAVIGLLAGIALGLLWHPVVPVWAEPYLPIAIVAAMDAVVGGIRALIERRFDERIFVISFLSNVLIAAFLVFLGDQLGVGAQISTGVVVVLAMRIFANAAAISGVVTTPASGCPSPAGLPNVTTSGTRPCVAKPQKSGPTRPKPTCTSSAMTRPPCARTASAPATR